MIDLGLLRENPDLLFKKIKKKEPSFPIELLAELDTTVRKLGHQIDLLRQQKNELAKQAQAGITPEVRDKSVAVSKEIKNLETEFETVSKKFQELYLSCPNIPDDSVPEGTKEQNKVVKTVGEKPTFNFPIKNHVELAQQLGWIDFEKAAQITASNFALYKGEGVYLIYALAMLMLKNNIKHGYAPILPSVLVNEQSLYVASNFPKFKDQVYAVQEDKLYLTPTAEVNLTNLYRENIFAREELPVRMTSWTSCFRREAGGYGANERGLIRIHQFEKVELYTMCEPEKSFDELDRMVACAESILQKLGLHYRISLLAGQDCSFPSAKTYDIEVWLPGQDRFMEVSSCSNCTDFQARRGSIRYKETAESKTKLVHTINASSLALPRLMVALMETYQQPDGSIKLPEILLKEALYQL